MFRVPNSYRRRSGDLRSDESYGNNGVFEFRWKGYSVVAIASDGLGWEHVSVTINRRRGPPWELMSFVKDTFWEPEDTVYQLHPPLSVYVNTNPYCLHLWRQIGKEVPVPPAHLVG